MLYLDMILPCFRCQECFVRTASSMFTPEKKNKKKTSHYRATDGPRLNHVLSPRLPSDFDGLPMAPGALQLPHEVCPGLQDQSLHPETHVLRGEQRTRRQGLAGCWDVWVVAFFACYILYMCVIDVENVKTSDVGFCDYVYGCHWSRFSATTIHCKHCCGGRLVVVDIFDQVLLGKVIVGQCRSRIEEPGSSTAYPRLLVTSTMYVLMFNHFL